MLMVAALSAFAQAPIPDATSTYETVKAADGIWAFIAPEPKSALVSGNSIAVIGDDGVLVVDTGLVPSLTRRMIAEIRQKTGKPVRYVVNTHWHADHNFGNFIYRDEYPGVTIISTPFTRKSMAEYAAHMLESYQKHGTAFVASLRQQLEAGKNPDGTAMTAEQKEEQSALVHDAEHAMPEMQKGRIELPNQTFDESVTIFLGKREVQIRYLGRANTAGDAVVYVPDAKVLMTGDLLVGPIPFATGSYLPEWIGAMKKLDAMDATVIVPGHGPVEHDKTHLHTMTNLLQTLLTQVQQAVQQGLTLEETRKKVDIANYRDQLTAGVPSRKRHFQEYFEQPAVDTLYKQLKGLPTSESPFQ
jgi:cyclase